MSERIEVQWCTTCGARFTEEEVTGKSSCPACGSKGVPCSTERDLVVEINWHELRILGIWASNWANAMSDVGEQGKGALRGILFRLQRQYPELPALSLGGEVRAIRQSGLVSEISTNIPAEGVVPVNGPGAVGRASTVTMSAELAELLRAAVDPNRSVGPRWVIEAADNWARSPQGKAFAKEQKP